MTGYLYAARICRTVAVLAVFATSWLLVAGQPWWAAVLTGYAAFIGFFMGRLLNVAHNRTVTSPSTRTRRKKAPTA